MSAEDRAEAGAGCPCGRTCICHDTPTTTVEGLGLEWRGLSPTELQMLALLAPGDETRTYGWLMDRLRPGEPWPPTTASHMLNVHAGRLRKRLRPQGWTIASVKLVGLRLQRITVSSQNRDSPETAPSPVTDASQRTLGTPKAEPSKPPAAIAEAAMEREWCARKGCGRRLADHARCSVCTQLAGPQHDLRELERGAEGFTQGAPLCPACHDAARRHAVSGGTAGPVQRPVDWRTEPAFSL